MDTCNSGINKDLAPSELFRDRIGANHLVFDVDKDGNPMKWPGKLIALVGPNLLFEKKNGIRILVNPCTVSRIIELQERRRP